MVTLDRLQRYSEDYRVKKARFGPLCKSCPRIIENRFLFAVNKNQVSISMV